MNTTAERDSISNATAAGICLQLVDDTQPPWLLSTLLYKRHGDVPGQKDDVNFPCGGIQPGESPWDAAVRELYEECMPDKHRKEITIERFTSHFFFLAYENRTVHGRVNKMFISTDPVDKNVVVMWHVMVPLNSSCYKNVVSKLAESSKLEDYTSDTGALEGLPFWQPAVTAGDWRAALCKSRYGEYNRAVLQWLYPGFDPEETANAGAV